MKMGHANVRNLSDIFIRRIYANGKTSIKEIAEWCAEKIKNASKSKKREAKENYSFCASECYYTDETNISIGLDIVLHHHVENGIIEPIITSTEAQDMYDRYRADEPCVQETNQELWDSIEWRFTEGSRRKYLDKQIKHINHITE